MEERCWRGTGHWQAPGLMVLELGRWVGVMDDVDLTMSIAVRKTVVEKVLE